MPVWSEVELAWRTRARRADGTFAPWLAVTGTNGKTTTVGMLEAILRAAGLRTRAVGNVGTPVTEVVQDVSLDVLAVELSSFQLHFTSSMAARAAAVLNVAPAHLDWHGSLEEYARAKGRVYAGVEVACVYAVADECTRRLVEDADVAEGARAVGVTLGAPGPGELGIIDGLLVDRSFHAPLDSFSRHDTAAELGALDDLAHLAGPDGRLAPHVVTDALTAAALARAHGVAARAVRDGLREYAPGAHRIEVVARSRRRLRRRLEGHERACRGSLARRVRARDGRVGRRRPCEGGGLRRARREPQGPPAGRRRDRHRRVGVARGTRATRGRRPHDEGRSR